MKERGIAALDEDLHLPSSALARACDAVAASETAAAPAVSPAGPCNVPGKVNESWRPSRTLPLDAAAASQDHNPAGSPVNESFGQAGLGISLSFKDITYTVSVKEKGKRNPKQILKGVTGSMRAGTINAIMGPSGGGKTSLLDVLADRKPKKTVTGMVLANGMPFIHKTFIHLAGYVVQDDVVMGTLTVRENLLFSARLRLPVTSAPGKVDDEEKKRRVQEVIEELGLDKYGFVRGISGGERKRVNIGMELVTAPSVLYLDEPTSGLDAATCMSLLLLLKNLAQKGRTIILSIHQPRFKIFQVVLKVHNDPQS
ncbi:P-loop containing nucleoside triphosphate hydrolase protein [Baffinella frigidus]|nr:P-loop containing nucleoside triphosphate hydrolase protein [Cryptophyta sp. CCMP2293]